MNPRPAARRPTEPNPPAPPPHPPGTAPPDAQPAEERGERMDTGKAEGDVPGGEPDE